MRGKGTFMEKTKKPQSIEIIYGSIVSISEKEIIAEIKTSEQVVKSITYTFEIFWEQVGRKVILYTWINSEIYFSSIPAKNLTEVKKQFPPSTLERTENLEKTIAELIAKQIETRIDFVNLLEENSYSPEIKSELLKIFQKVQHELKNE